MVAKKTSSPKKRTKKAATQRRSTTSSITEKEGSQQKAGSSKKTKKRAEGRQPPGLLDEENATENIEELVPLNRTQQSAVLELLYRGASPAGACGQVGVSVEAFLKTATDDEEFRARVRETTGVLSGNVMAVLYRTAMEGNVSAQQAWLKLFPPPSFAEPIAETEPMTFDELLGDLTDAELVELAQAVGIDLPHEAETNLASENLSYLTEQISQRFAIDAGQPANLR
ncbi:MAG: hypothetical protein KDA84_25565 [Planctomycetaceae bacterium]|nr:hypothetical protein [Planctomycetaceae bacterium]